MKKHFRLICTMCLAGTLAFFASSCNKNEEKQVAQIMMPDFVDDGTEFTSDGSKSYINLGGDGQFIWEATDEIMMYNVDNKGDSNEKAIFVNNGSTVNQPKAYFEYSSGRPIGAKKDHYFVFYPPKMVPNRNDETLPGKNVETFRVLGSQDYTLTPQDNPTVDPEALALATETYDLGEPFILQHIFGIMRLRLHAENDGVVVDKIVVEDAYRHLTGQVWMRLHNVRSTTFNELIQADTYTWYNLNHPQDPNNTFYNKWRAYARELGYGGETEGFEVTLNCRSADAPTGVTLATGSNFTPFYIALRPGALIGGFKVIVYYHVGTGAPYSKTKEIESWNHGPLNEGVGLGYTIIPGKVTGFKFNEKLQ